jgi:Uma2 family endonuclease
VSAQAGLFTVEQYEQIPDPPGGRYELRHGELVVREWPIRPHKDLQRRLRGMLEKAARQTGYVADTDYPYRPLPENELWGADVVCLKESRERTPDNWLMGSPELVIEVRSPEDGKYELYDRAMTTLAGEGAVEFWVIDPKSSSATVYSKTGGIHAYSAPMAVPLAMFGGSIDLGALFAME